MTHVCNDLRWLNSLWLFCGATKTPQDFDDTLQLALWRLARTYFYLISKAAAGTQVRIICIMSARCFGAFFVSVDNGASGVLGSNVGSGKPGVITGGHEMFA